MTRTISFASIAAFAVTFSSPEISAETRIVVNFGLHPSAAVASTSEEQVDWLDANESDDTICTECFAAVELQHYLRAVTGRQKDFVVVDDNILPEGDLILLGPPTSNSATRQLLDRMGVTANELVRLGMEAYRIKTGTVDQRRVTLVAGGGRTGTLYGVYDLLHRIGCRWFAPGELHEEVPRIEWQPDFDVREEPDFSTRGFHVWQHRVTPEFLLWMTRNRLNYWCVEQKEQALMHKLGLQKSCGGHTAQNMFLAPYDPYPYEHPSFKDDDAKPGDPYPLSDQFQGDRDEDGTLSYFEAHPEWYALIGGKRIPGMQKNRPGFGTNYCTSNTQATDEFMKNFAAALTDGPYRHADVVRFWTLDVGKWCQCQQCTALGSPSDRNLLLVHRLNQEIKRARQEGTIHRPIIIRFLAYADVLDPPTRQLPADFDYATCSATFFPIVRCYVHSFDDESCPKNNSYQQQLRAWATAPERHYRGQICIGEYYNVSGYRNLPICFMHTMANDIPYFHSVGARHFHYMHVTGGNWGNKALTNYQMARQLWDVRLDCESLWEDYFAR